MYLYRDKVQKQGRKLDLYIGWQEEVISDPD